MVIEVISVNGLYDDSYKKIIDKMESIRNVYLKHGFELSLLGTGNLEFALADFNLSLITDDSLRKTTLSELSKLRRRLINEQKILFNINKTVWTKDQILRSTLPFPVRRVEYPWTIMKANLDKPYKILDVGSGISLFPIYLASNGHEVFSIDNDEILVNRVAPQLAKWAGVHVNYGLGDATKIQFDDNTFDRVFCISVLEHLEEELVNGKRVNYHKLGLDIKAIDEMLRVLKVGGFLILTFDWSENPDDQRSYKLQDIYDKIQKYRSCLVIDKKPEIDWNELKSKHIEAWKAFPPYNYVLDGWAVGIVLQKINST